MADRAYLDFTWFHQLQARGVTFVTRLKRGVRYRVTREHEVRAGTGILSDQTIELTSARSRKVYPHRLRRVVYRDPLTRNRYVFVTNNTTWVAKTIADLYKSRWQIELFFKWIKQHLKVKRFVGRSKKRGLDATVGGHLHVPAAGLPPSSSCGCAGASTRCCRCCSSTSSNAGLSKTSSPPIRHQTAPRRNSRSLGPETVGH